MAAADALAVVPAASEGLNTGDPVDVYSLRDLGA
jgi:hypothetical protein